MPRKTVVIIGAGIVGASTALALQQQGDEVVLVDRVGPAAGASFGNAGAVVNASCIPTAMPGIATDVLRMIGRPLSPFTVRLSYLPRILPWMIRFLGESRLSRVRENARHLHALTASAAASWERMTAGTELAGYLRPVGWLKVYETEESFDRSAPGRWLMDELCVPYEILDAAELQDLEPELSPIFERAVLQRDSLQVTDPGALLVAMVDLFVSRGGEYRQFEAKRIAVNGDEAAIHGPAGSIEADKVVIAAGAWSDELARAVGDRTWLDTERGYHVMLPATNNRMLGRPVMSADHSFALSPMEQGFRITSQVEFAGVDATPDYRRIRSLVRMAERMLPGLDTTEESVWMGCRPSLPDSLPVIGVSPRNDGIIYAFGHQHLGLTLGPVTGYIVADLVAGRDTGVDLAPYRIDR